MVIRGAKGEVRLQRHARNKDETKDKPTHFTRCCFYCPVVIIRYPLRFIRGPNIALLPRELSVTTLLTEAFQAMIGFPVGEDGRR